MPSLHHNQVISDEPIVSRRQPTTSRSTKNNMSLVLPDLDRLAILHSTQDKLLRADGNFCSLLVSVTDGNNASYDQHIF